MKKIIKQRTSIVCVVDKKLLGFFAEDPLSKERKFFLPGGKALQNESMFDCAVRESKEETGYALQIERKSEYKSRYDFLWNGVLYDCITYYFAGTLKVDSMPATINDATYHRGVEWISLKDLDLFLGHSLEILMDTKKIIKLWF